MEETKSSYVTELQEFDRCIAAYERWIRYYQARLAGAIKLKKELLGARSELLVEKDDDPETYTIPDRLTKKEQTRLTNLESILNVPDDQASPTKDPQSVMADMDRIEKIKSERRRQQREHEEIIQQLRKEEEELKKEGVPPLELQSRMNARHREIMNQRYPMKPGHRQMQITTGFLGLQTKEEDPVDERKAKLAEALGKIQQQLDQMNASRSEQES